MEASLPVNEVYFEGSPNLGYLSHDQMQEHVQLHLEVDDRRAASIADKIFRNIGVDNGHHLGSGLRRGELGELVIEPDGNTSYADWEVGWGGTWNELGVVAGGEHNLINLDYLVSEVGSRVSDLKKHYTAQVADCLGSYIAERYAILGLEQQG